MSVAVPHGRTATSVAARRAPPPKKHGNRPNPRPRTVDLHRGSLKKHIALSAWESDQSGLPEPLTNQAGRPRVSVIDP